MILLLRANFMLSLGLSPRADVWAASWEAEHARALYREPYGTDSL
jgi:hypothetical protein